MELEHTTDGTLIPSHIRLMETEDIEALVSLSLLAWEPVFHSFEAVLGAGIYQVIYPDWRKSQREAVESVLRDQEKFTSWVAEVDEHPVGFVAYQLDHQTFTGEVYMLAVHPNYQNRGIGTKLNQVALNQMRAAGMKLVEVGTGGDPGHAPARRSYEKAGYTPLPLVRYYQNL